MKNTSLTVAEVAAAMSAKHYMRQLHGKRCRVVLWRPDEMFPQPLLRGSAADKKAALRHAGLDPAAALPLWDELIPLLPEAPTMAEASRRDAEGYKLKLSAAELCAYKRSGVLPLTKRQLNESVKALAARDRPSALAILNRYGATCTPEIKPEDIPAAHAAFVEALAKIASTP
jgi:hypothetical protein